MLDTQTELYFVNGSAPVYLVIIERGERNERARVHAHISVDSIIRYYISYTRLRFDLTIVSLAVRVIIITIVIIIVYMLSTMRCIVESCKIYEATIPRDTERDEPTTARIRRFRGRKRDGRTITWTTRTTRRYERPSGRAREATSLARDSSSGKRAREIGRCPSSGARSGRRHKSEARAGPRGSRRELSRMRTTGNMHEARRKTEETHN